MFKFSLDWVRGLLGEESSLNSILDILCLQGFEVKTVEEINGDQVITIEVKANRPDILSHIGVAREITSFKEFADVSVFDISSYYEFDNTKPNNSEFPVSVKIEEGTCERFSAIMIEGIDNHAKTPNFIKKRLEIFGVNSINAIVDISNYVMLEMGQPTHIYDLDKISNGEIFVQKAKKEEVFLTLTGKSFEVKVGDITIRDNLGVICMAGIIGSQRVEVDEDSKKIMIESAVFEKTAVRVASKRSKISTPASFRFERGVNAKASLDAARILAKKIVETCGGKICGIFDYKCKGLFKENKIRIRVPRVNLVLGTYLIKSEITKYIAKYGFVCCNDSGDALEVLAPHFRLDIDSEIDVIEEVARGFGYNRIEPTNLLADTAYRKNEVYSALDTIRNIMVGVGADEVITYSFIQSNAMEVLGILPKDKAYGDVFLQNPISSSYSLMRPTLVVSLLQTLSYNYSMGNYDLILFELGRTYVRDQNYDTGYKETDVLGVIISGNKINKGWGIKDDLKFDFYDLNDLINIIYNEFGQDFSVLPGEFLFLNNEKSALFSSICHGFEINVEGKYSGFFGEINKKIFSEIVPNVKLIKDDIFYCEIFIESIKENKKQLKFESKFPLILRMYNLNCPKDVSASRITDVIKNSADFVRNIKIKDVYGSEEKDNHALLFEVSYRLSSRTLTTKEIEDTEHIFLDKLNKELGVSVKL
ncbi:MAG: phenylalanine--tRNA ligase subunit beta [Oscillospiraceae bacterium]|jgi:phenylalanyl-tRNA synthetase beta chain|nr:phenylalanine--tRNA ligase subunit beta [Oscillospiraceae bacterium]